MGSLEDDRDITDATGFGLWNRFVFLLRAARRWTLLAVTREGVYVLVRRTLVQLEYHHRLSKPDKGLVKRYLEKVTGLSRSQLTRLIGPASSDREDQGPARQGASAAV